MPIGAITMILTNVGLQIFNNWCGSRQNKTIQQKREEFESAARERNTQRMWQLMREGQELTRQLEEEKHQQRLEELRNDIGSLLQKLTYAATINNWPLNVLPIVMKNQALGNLLANQEESIALHCIFTPSNSLEFNRTIFPRIEEALEVYCNQHWSVMSDHPILFYSGAWKSLQSPTEVQIDSMRTALSNLPTLVITPFFRPNDGKFVFHVRIWGVGASSSDEFSIPEIEPTNFQRSYQTGDDYVNDSTIADELFEDIVPYLQCLIGYMADTYFWSSLGKAPHLPLLITDGAINTDGMKYLVSDSREYYDQLLLSSEENAKGNPFMQENLLNLYEGSAELWDDDTRSWNLEKAFLTYVNSHNGQNILSIKDALDPTLFSKEDLPFIETSLSVFADSEYETELKSIKMVLDAVNFDYSILDSTDISYLEKLADAGSGAAMYRLGEIYEYSLGVNYCDNKASHYYTLSLEKNFILGKISYSFTNDELISSVEISSLKYLCDRHVEAAIVRLSQMLYTGFCIPKNIESALEIIENIDEPRNSYTYYWGAKMVIDLYGAEQKESIEQLLCKSADMGNISSQLLLIDMYQSGYILDIVPSKSAFYAQKAAKQGCIKAITKLGIFYIKGFGVPRSIPYGKKLLEISSNHNDLEAINYLKQY